MTDGASRTGPVIPAAPVALAIGDDLPRSSFGPLTRTDIVRYAGASGDLNPIHHDEPFARAAGMPSVLGVGMHTAGILGQRVAAWVGPDNLRSFEVRFVGRVWPGDVLTFSGRVESIAPGPDGAPLARIALDVRRQDDEQALRGRAVALVAVRATGPASGELPHPGK